MVLWRCPNGFTHCVKVSISHCHNLERIVVVVLGLRYRLVWFRISGVVSPPELFYDHMDIRMDRLLVDSVDVFLGGKQ